MDGQGRTGITGRAACLVIVAVAPLLSVREWRLKAGLSTFRRETKSEKRRGSYDLAAIAGFHSGGERFLSAAVVVDGFSSYFASVSRRDEPTLRVGFRGRHYVPASLREVLTRVAVVAVLWRADFSRS